MRAHAQARGQDADAWGTVGLLHDFDWERYPTLEDHPVRGSAELEARGYPAWFRRAILAHAPHTGTSRDSDLERHLFACDELTGFVHACALMRPTRLNGMTPASVRKKMKDKRFAANVSREDIVVGSEEIGRELNDHIAFVIAALAPHADELGLTPPAT